MFAQPSVLSAILVTARSQLADDSRLIASPRISKPELGPDGFNVNVATWQTSSPQLHRRYLLRKIKSSARVLATVGVLSTGIRQRSSARFFHGIFDTVRPSVA